MYRYPLIITCTIRGETDFDSLRYCKHIMKKSIIVPFHLNANFLKSAPQQTIYICINISTEQTSDQKSSQVRIRRILCSQGIF